MFDIGWSELVVIAVVALIAIGPKELPGVLRAVGNYMGKIRRMASEFQGQFQEAMREAEVADLKKSVDEMTKSASKSFTDFDPIGSVRKEIESFTADPLADKPPAPESVSPKASRQGPRCRARPRRLRPTLPYRRRLRPTQRSPLKRRSRKPRARPQAKARPGAARENRRRREGDRGHQGAADVAPDRAALAADQGAGGVLHRRRVLLLLCQADLQHPGLALRVGRRRGELEVHLHRAARILHHPVEAVAVRRGLHRVPGDRDADLHVRRARPLPQRAAGVRAVSGGDAVLLRARRGDGLFHRHADAGALLARHAADRRARGSPRSRCCPRSANTCR